MPVQDTSTVISMKETRHYGNVSIELELSIRKVIGSVADYDREVDRLALRLSQQHDRIAPKYAANASRSVHETMTPPKPEQDSVSIPVEKIICTTQGGKQSVKVHGGQWSKFGVMMYPELWTKHRLYPILGDNFGEYIPDVPMTAQIELYNGKPKRVYKLYEDTV